MSPSLSDARTIAAEIDAARRAGCPIAPPPGLALIRLRDAYDIQDSVVACRESGGDVRSGWKLGLTSGVKQRVMGIDRPVFGRIFAGGQIASGGRVECAAFSAPRAEPELAFGLATPIESDADHLALLAAIDWVAPALEITDSRYRPGQRTAVELIADNTSAAAYVLGPRVSRANAPRLDAIGTELLRNGTLVAAGSTADVLGNPLAALTCLAAHLAERGLTARPGDVVLSGAITDAFPASRGDRFEARLRGLAAVDVLFT